ncbi:MAG: 5'/3'-nucleotidase SurE [Alphaproteobacteria bacterium]
MRILVTNDDGVHGPGLDVLERIARAVGDDVWVVAPETDQSGLSHSLSLSNPLRLREMSDRHFAVRGTPSDCVIMAIRRLMPERPDLVLSGVNAGTNIADDVTYSGTVAGAIEGTLLGIPSIALSQGYVYDGGRKIPWQTAEELAPDIIRSLQAYGFPQGVLYNVNFPNCAPNDVAGTRITTQGSHAHRLHIDERRDGRGDSYFWLAYRHEESVIEPGTDVEAVVVDKHISVTPLRLDLTAHQVSAGLTEHFRQREDNV